VCGTQSKSPADAPMKVVGRHCAHGNGAACTDCRCVTFVLNLDVQTVNVLRLTEEQGEELAQRVLEAAIDDDRRKGPCEQRRFSSSADH
jgi:hypothetical protein